MSWAGQAEFTKRPIKGTLQRHKQNNISLEVLRDNSQNATKLQLQSMCENKAFSDILWSYVVGNSFKYIVMREYVVKRFAKF